MSELLKHQLTVRDTVQEAASVAAFCMVNAVPAKADRDGERFAVWVRDSDRERAKRLMEQSDRIRREELALAG